MRKRNICFSLHRWDLSIWKMFLESRTRVGLVNVGVEEAKGNQLVKETGPLLKECENINYIGSIEAREIPYGAADVVVCDAFAGNIVLKLEEGLAAVLVSQIKEGMMSTLKSKIGALLAKPALKKTLKKFDASEYGGAPLLGLNGLVVKAHGSSSAKEMKNANQFSVSHLPKKILRRRSKTDCEG